ncbi:hypothetical protein D3C78_1764900 [compost metagenome]
MAAYLSVMRAKPHEVAFRFSQIQLGVRNSTHRIFYMTVWDSTIIFTEHNQRSRLNPCKIPTIVMNIVHKS